VLFRSIKTTLKINSSHQIVQDVQDGQLEIGVVGARWSEKGLDFREIYSDTLSVVVGTDHHLAGKKEISLAELIAEPFIFRESGSGTRRVVDQIFEDHGVKESSLCEVAEIGSTEAVLQAVKEGLGISIVSTKAVEKDLRAGTIASLAVKGVKMERPFYMIRRKNRELSPAASVFWIFLLQEA